MVRENETMECPKMAKKHRLSVNSYKGRVRVTFTLCIEGRETFFTVKETVDAFVGILTAAKNKCDCKNWAYIFMPDHLHMVLEGSSEDSDLLKAVGIFKQESGFWLTKNTRGIRWQKGFYDHIHRRNEDLKKHISYIVDNPVRKGLVNNWREYLFKGSTDFDLEKIIG